MVECDTYCHRLGFKMFCCVEKIWNWMRWARLQVLSVGTDTGEKNEKHKGWKHLDAAWLRNELKQFRHLQSRHVKKQIGKGMRANRWTNHEFDIYTCTRRTDKSQQQVNGGLLHGILILVKCENTSLEEESSPGSCSLFMAFTLDSGRLHICMYVCIYIYIGIHLQSLTLHGYQGTRWHSPFSLSHPKLSEPTAKSNETLICGGFPWVAAASQPDQRSQIPGILIPGPSRDVSDLQCTNTGGIHKNWNIRITAARGSFSSR